MKKTLWQIGGFRTQINVIEAVNQSCSVLLFFIPGNPGVIDFYDQFLQSIHQKCDQRLNVIGVQHAKHTKESFIEQYPLVHSVKFNESEELRQTGLFGLQDQINHQLAILDHLVAEEYKDARIILAGHSVGAYICTEIIKARPAYNFERSLLLFPTLENIAATPNGSLLSPAFSWMGRLCLSSAATALSFLPVNALQSAVSRVIGTNDAESAIVASQMIDSDVCQNALYMAYTEMAQIQNLDERFYKEHIDKLIFYYGVDDRWAPVKHYQDMKARFPSGQVHLCSNGLSHSFVLGGQGSETMATIASEWLQQHL
ncbi:hypothetical protein MP228_001546 [Amoeboaphelidium protococcarum]|nr:hypothetical protein MP228_001546 [Amoeboaphelidium protococcarum]